MIRLALLLALLGFSQPAQAHSLRLFAQVSGDQVSGYGFFIGGGRAAGALWRAERGGQELAHGRTDAAGKFAFMQIPSAERLVITLDTEEGHVARREIGAPKSAPQTAPESADLKALLRAEIAPLSEQIAQMEARIRLTDRLAALCLIFGLAGMALWLRGGRR